MFNCRPTNVQIILRLFCANNMFTWNNLFYSQTASSRWRSCPLLIWKLCLPLGVKETKTDITDNIGCACGKISDKTTILIHDRFVYNIKTYSRNARISRLPWFLCHAFRSSQYFVLQSNKEQYNNPVPVVCKCCNV
jgi:hypothetical protein